MAKTKESKQQMKDEEDDLRKNPINIFQCAVCKDAKELGFLEFKNHLRDEHKINTEDRDQMKGKRNMTLHMDGDFWFASNYEWTLEGGLKFYQYCKNARANDDPMRFAH